MLITLLLFVLILGVTVCVHEFGHYIFAKMVGIRVYEFAIGMGPTIVKTKPKGKDKTVYSLRAIPIGGFCSLAGEEVEQDTDKAKENKGRNIQDKKLWQRFLVMFFGAGFNFIFAFLVVFIMGLVFGTSSYKPIVDTPDETAPMYVAGVRSGDYIVEIDGHKTKYFDDVRIFISLHCSDSLEKVTNNEEVTPISVKVKRNGEYYTYNVVPNIITSDEGTSTCLYGVSKNMDTKPNIFAYTYANTMKYFRQMFLTFELLFTGKAGIKDLSGPVGIYSIVGQARKTGIATVLELVVLLNVNIGFINLLPFPAFDGGRILFLFIEKIKGSPVNPKVENIIHTVGFALLMLLMIYVTFNDIIKLF